MNTNIDESRKISEMLKGIERNINSVPEIEDDPAVAKYAPPALRGARNDALYHRSESQLDPLATQLLRLTYIEMMSFCREVIGEDDITKANELADKTHKWAAARAAK